MTPTDLRARRAALGLSQAQLAARLGVDVMTVSRWERGELSIAHPAMLALALDALAAQRNVRSTPVINYAAQFDHRAAREGHPHDCPHCGQEWSHHVAYCDLPRVACTLPEHVRLLAATD